MTCALGIQEKHETNVSRLVRCVPAAGRGRRLGAFDNNVRATQCRKPIRSDIYFSAVNLSLYIYTHMYSGRERNAVDICTGLNVVVIYCFYKICNECFEAQGYKIQCLYYIVKYTVPLTWLFHQQVLSHFINN